MKKHKQRKGLSFKEAEAVAERRRRLNSPENFRKVTIQQGKGSVTPKDLPFVEDCYRLGSSATVAVIDNLNNVLSIEDAKKLSGLLPMLHDYEFDALLREEFPKLYTAYKGRLTHPALCIFIDFRAGKKLDFKVRVKG
jgi:hypothetical protein